MNALVMRVAILAAVGLASGVAIWLGRAMVSRRQGRALAAPAFLAGGGTALVSILAFHTDDCRQCLTMQTPALERVLAARGTTIRVIDIDAIARPELAEQYQVMTVPTTVILDAQGKAVAINYGFTPTQRLLQQVDALLATT